MKDNLQMILLVIGIGIFLFVVIFLLVGTDNRKDRSERCVELYGEGHGFSPGGFGESHCIAPDGSIKGYWREKRSF